MCPGLENILLAVVSEVHEDQRCMISFISGIFYHFNVDLRD